MNKMIYFDAIIPPEEYVEDFFVNMPPLVWILLVFLIVGLLVILTRKKTQKK